MKIFACLNWVSKNDNFFRIVVFRPDIESASAFCSYFREVEIPREDLSRMMEYDLEEYIADHIEIKRVESDILEDGWDLEFRENLIGAWESLDEFQKSLVVSNYLNTDGYDYDPFWFSSLEMLEREFPDKGVDKSRRCGRLISPSPPAV